MVSKNIDLVLVDTIVSGRIIARAPGFSGLREGDDVSISGCHTGGTVLKVVTIDSDSNMKDFILTATGRKEPLPKITSKILYEDFKYDDEPKEETDG